ALGAKLGKNAIIVAEGDNGAFVGGTDFTQPLQLQPGQALLGGGSVVPLHDSSNHGVTKNFDVPGTRPTVVGNDANANLINMYSGSQNRITGLDLVGPFSNGVYGHNMVRAVITGNSITGGAGDGIFLRQKGGTPSSSFVDVSGNLVANNAGN